MDILLVGPGRAGMALAIAARRVGHTVTGVIARTPQAAAAAGEALDAPIVSKGADLPPSDLVMIAVRDDDIAAVADELAAGAAACTAAVHLSGLVEVAALRSLDDAGLAIGSFHPLQTLPTPEAGAAQLAGSWFGVTTDDVGLHAGLDDLAHSLGATTFDLPEEVKATYHAAAAAAANFPLVALTMAADLFTAAGVPFEAARPLVESVVANAFELGPRAALTGPVSRGDVQTVSGHLDAVAAASSDWLPTFAALVTELAKLSGRADAFDELLQSWRAPRDRA